MDTEAPKLSIFFLPLVGGGHLIPMIDLTRLFSTHNVKSTILAVPNDASVFQSTITRDRQNLGLDIHLLTLQLPLTDQPHAVTAVNMSVSSFTDTSILQQPLVDLLRRYHPDCIVTDTFHRWAADAVDVVGIPRVIFDGNCCFARCFEESLQKDWLLKSSPPLRLILEISGFLRNVSDLAGMFCTPIVSSGSLWNLPDYNGSLRILPDTSGFYRKLSVLEASRFFTIIPHSPHLSRIFLYYL